MERMEAGRNAPRGDLNFSEAQSPHQLGDDGIFSKTPPVQGVVNQPAGE